ncbi:MAG: T9SS type A sorting domain-containing protein [Bacteroidales bacterium]|nr:T9SS type A sorting domain-containing protein [Bacteroidales bacterium]
MKKNLTIIVLAVLISFSVHGQNFISTEKQWNVMLTAFPLSNTTEIYKINGDSTVNLTDYSKIWASFDSLATWHFKGLLREESNIVYYIPPVGAEGILYDFNLEIGDNTYINNVFCSDIPIYVIDIDTVEYFGTSRKRWLIGENGIVDEVWVEGIGSLNGPLYSKYWNCIICPVWELLCFHESDTLKYMKPFETNCYYSTVGVAEKAVENDFIVSPNPAKKGNEISLETTSKMLSISVFDVTGRLVKTINPLHVNKINIETSNFEPGLYLITVATDREKIMTRKILIE